MQSLLKKGLLAHPESPNSKPELSLLFGKLPAPEVVAARASGVKAFSEKSEPGSTTLILEREVMAKCKVFARLLQGWNTCLPANVLNKQHPKPLNPKFRGL